MSKINILIVFFILFFQTAKSAETTNFFHQKSVFQISGEQIFDIPAWKIKLDAPIRASAAFDNNSLYIGTAKGVFYAINQADGKIVWEYKTDSAIHSTAAFDNGKLYFTDNKQTLYCLNAKDGKLQFLQQLFTEKEIVEHQEKLARSKK